MDKIIVLGKLKFDLRDPDEAYFAKYEFESIIGVDVTPVKTIPALFKTHPLNKLDDEIIHIITRHLYLGEIQGYKAEVDTLNADKLIFQPAFFKEVYLMMETDKNKENILTELNLVATEKLYNIFKVTLNNNKKLFVLRLLPIQALFEYGVEVKKLPAAVFNPKNYNNCNEYFKEKELGIEQGLDELLNHLRNEHFRAPHFGLGKRHIGDFIDWASTDLRKPFLHYLHKYKGKGDPRISRALINLLKVTKGETILDPFVGSGAFIMDAPTMGLNAIGVEILRIGELISKVKCNFNYNLEKLREEIVNISQNINYYGSSLFAPKIGEDIENLKVKIRRYTEGTRFISNILSHLPKIVYLKQRIDKVQDEKIKNFLLILLSQKIVEFSEKRRSNNFISSFLTYVEDRYLTLYATIKLAKKLNININDGKVDIIRGDSTKMDFIKDGSIDGILTSPPYFDALDYIGNNKVSIIILGFDDDLKFGSTKEYYNAFEKYSDLKLPESNIALLELLRKSRRSIKAQIVENYLRMMKLSFRECFRVLKNDKFYAMVVSKYHSWIINGQEQRIETSGILADLGVSEGFKLARIIQHGLSKADKGKINVEDILLFQR
jgi:tRNA G10  N-methylase Trm11